MPDLSPDTQAILLLCSTFAEGQRDPKPLTLREYNSLASWLIDQHRRPADLFAASNGDLSGAPIEHERLERLLGRGPSLAVSLERWDQLGVWVVGRGDASYPHRLKRVLGSRAPAYLYGVGQRALLGQGGLAIVGSRDADPTTLEFVAAVARRCAGEDLPVVSGGARGVDETAMQATVAAGGAAVGVLSHGLARAAVARKHRSDLRAGRLVLISAVHPGSGFNAGAAMGRNKYIYALAQAALVARSGTDGGTWAGATECLRAGWVPVFVRPLEDEGTGNAALLRHKGAVHAWPASPDIALRDLLSRHIAEPVPKAQLGLFGGQRASEPAAATAEPVIAPAPSRGSTVGPSAAADPAPPIPPATITTGEDFYALFVQFLSDYLTTPRRREEIVNALELKQGQVQDWLNRAVADGRIIKSRTRPVRYELPPPPD